MKNIRHAFATVVLAGLMSAGCFLVSGQFTVVFNFDSPLVVSSGGTLQAVDVDLNTVSEYEDNKDKLKDVVDLAILGRFTNSGPESVTIEVWMLATPNASVDTDAEVRANATRIWGPFTVNVDETRTVGWDQSAELFTGRQMLIDEVKGDGQFSLFALGSTAPYTFTIENGAVVAVISAGQ
jgi:hypothetical protein